MPKSQYVDPGKVFERGFAEFTPIPLCQYNKTLKEEKAIYTKEDFLLHLPRYAHHPRIRDDAQ